MIQRGVWTSKAAIATAFACSITTVNNWTMRPGFPGGRTGPWPQAAVREFLHQIGSPYGIGESKEELQGASAARMALTAKVLKLREEVRRIRFANDLAERQFIRLEKVELALAELFGRFRHRMEAWVEEFELEFPKKQRAKVREIARRKVDQVLREMAAWDGIEVEEGLRVES